MEFDKYVSKSKDAKLRKSTSPLEGVNEWLDKTGMTYSVQKIIAEVSSVLPVSTETAESADSAESESESKTIRVVVIGKA